MIDKIKGELRVFVREHGKGKSKRKLYNACLGSAKDEDDEWVNWYVLLNFSKNVKKKLPDKKDSESFEIVVKEAWFSPYRDKEDNVKIVLFVNKATIVDVKKDEEEEEDE